MTRSAFTDEDWVRPVEGDGAVIPCFVPHKGQAPPEGDWRVWLFMGGRGAGKTRAGAEWVRAMVASGKAKRVALVGPSLGDVREVMIEGPSGLRSICAEMERPVYMVSRRRLAWPNGAEGFVFSAEDAESLRGPQFDAAWCDEIAAWPKGRYVWNMLMFGLRLGRAPRVAATTTPRPVELVKHLFQRSQREGGGVALTRATMRDNAPNLAPGFVSDMEEMFNGAGLGRQELDGELVLDTPDALWTREMIETGRVPGEEARHGYDRIVVAVDPPATSGPGADACGIIVAGLRGGLIHILADASERHLRPLDWAARVVALARQWKCREIVAEVNQGGDMVSEVLAMAGGGPQHGFLIRPQRAVESKQARAMPVAAMYAKQIVRHAGVFRELEDELLTFGAAGSRSPDRLDAMVWAVRELAGAWKARPSITGL